MDFLVKQQGCYVVKISLYKDYLTLVDQDEGGCHQITQRQTRRHTHARAAPQTRTQRTTVPVQPTGVFQDFDLNFVVCHLARPQSVDELCVASERDSGGGEGREGETNWGEGQRVRGQKTARRMREPSLRRCCHSPSFIIYN